MSTATMARPPQPGIEIQRDREVYAHSTVAMQELGHIARLGFESAEAEALVQEVWNDFLTATEENLTTDPEYGDKLKFNPLKARSIVGGHVIDSRGRSLDDVVMEGYFASKRAVEDDPEMNLQVERDQGDIQVAKTVDTLEIGELYAVVSVEPKDALRRNPTYWRNKGYREGMAVAQIYYKKDDKTLLAGAYSIKESDTNALRRILAKHNVVVPEGISDNHWTRYGVRIKTDLIGAQSFGHQLQEDHRVEINKPYKEISVTDLIAANRDTVQRYFDCYIKPLCLARASGENNETMQSLAVSLLMNVKKLEPEEAEQLLQISSSQKFTIKDTRLMEEKIRYALVEELRQKVPELLKHGQPEPKVQPTEINYVPVTCTTDPAALVMMNQRIAAHVARGEAAGRSYGGCAGAGKDRYQKNIDGYDENELDPDHPQNVYGGKDTEKEESKNKNVECDYKGTFCYCCPYNSDGTPALRPYEVTARREKDGVAHCLRAGCGATLDSKGNAKKGEIYRKAMALLEKKAA